MPLEVYRVSRVPPVPPAEPSKPRSLVDYLVRCRGLQEWRVVRVGVSTLVGEVVEAIAFEFSGNPVLEQCNLFYEKHSLPFDMRVCGVPAQAQFKPGEKPQTTSGCLHFEMAFPRPPPLTPSLLNMLAEKDHNQTSQRLPLNSSRSLRSQDDDRSIMSSSRWSDTTGQTTIQTRPAESNLLITIKLLGTGDEPRRMYVCKDDSVVTIREVLGVPPDRFTLCCDGRPILNESSTFANLHITRKNILSFKAGAARTILPKQPTSGATSRTASVRRLHLSGSSGSAPVREAMSPSRAPKLHELASTTSPMASNLSLPTSPTRGGDSRTPWSTLDTSTSRRLPESFSAPDTPLSALRHARYPQSYTSSVVALSEEADNDYLSNSYSGTNPNPRGRHQGSASSPPLSPLVIGSTGKISILFIDPDDLEFVHTLQVNPSRAAFGLFSFVNGGRDEFNMYCDGVVVRDPMMSFLQVTNGNDGCVFSFRLRNF